MKGRLRVRSVARGALPPDAHPGEALVALLGKAVAAGGSGPTGVVVRAGALDLVDLGTARAAGMPVPWLLAGLTSTVTSAGPVIAVGLLGVMGRKVPGAERPARVAVVFLEWEDNRWWWYEALLDEGGRTVLPETARVRAAEEGDPMPQGLGRWWSAARRSGLRMELARDGAPADIVH